MQLLAPIVLSLFMSSSSLAFKHNKCIDIADGLKEQMFLEFESMHRNMANRNANENKFMDNPYGEQYDFTDYRKKGDCKMKKSNFPADVLVSSNKLATCPWNYVLKKRTDKYPTHVIEAQCLCEYHSKENGLVSLREQMAYQCVPVLQAKPVLVRHSECNAQGYYRWIPSTEMVNIACVSIEHKNPVY